MITIVIMIMIMIIIISIIISSSSSSSSSRSRRSRRPGRPLAASAKLRAASVGHGGHTERPHPQKSHRATLVKLDCSEQAQLCA